MKKFIFSLCLLIALSLLVLPFAVSAAYNDFVTDAIVSVSISDLGITLTIDANATLDKMVVNSGTVDLTMSEGSHITFRTVSRKQLNVTGMNPAVISTSCDSNESSVTLNVTAGYGTQTGVLTPASTACVAGGGGGGGGAGGAGGVSVSPTVVTPTDTSISINAGAAQTRSREVTLTLGATNATTMMISESSSFTGASWVDYATSKSFTLSEGVGSKIVYAKFKSSTGGISSAVSDSIELSEVLVASVTQSVVASTGGSVALADNSTSVTIPGGAVSGNADVTIAPTENYTAPEVGRGVVGGVAYSFSASVGGSTVETFLKNVTLTFNYTDNQIKGLKESTLKIYYWNGTLSQWVLAGGVVNALNNTISVDINHFTLFLVMGDKEFGSGDLVKLECDGTNTSICSAVYYLGANGKRYVFPNEKIYYSWYDDFLSVKIIGATDLASYMIGGNVTYRPGIRMVKITSDPKVYAVAKNGVLRWVQSESVASALYGSTWNKYIDDLVDSFFFSYTIGSDITMVADYNKSAVTTASPNINTDKGL